MLGLPVKGAGWRVHQHVDNPGARIWGYFKVFQGISRYFEVFWDILGHFLIILGILGAFWGILGLGDFGV